MSILGGFCWSSELWVLCYKFTCDFVGDLYCGGSYLKGFAGAADSCNCADSESFLEAYAGVGAAACSGGPSFDCLKEAHRSFVGCRGFGQVCAGSSVFGPAGGRCCGTQTPSSSIEAFRGLVPTGCSQSWRIALFCSF